MSPLLGGEFQLERASGIGSSTDHLFIVSVHTMHWEACMKRLGLGYCTSRCRIGALVISDPCIACLHTQK